MGSHVPAISLADYVLEELQGPTIWTDLEALNITFRHVAGHTGPKVPHGNFGTRVAGQITFRDVAFSLVASVVENLEISSPIFWPQCIEGAAQSSAREL